MTISESLRPATRRDLLCSDLNDGCVLYDRNAETTYTLNITASLIWSYLDGSLSLKEIADEVSSIGGSDEEKVLLDVVKAVTFFYENGLLEHQRN